MTTPDDSFEFTTSLEMVDGDGANSSIALIAKVEQGVPILLTGLFADSSSQNADVKSLRGRIVESKVDQSTMAALLDLSALAGFHAIRGVVQEVGLLDDPLLFKNRISALHALEATGDSVAKRALELIGQASKPAVPLGRIQTEGVNPTIGVE